MLKSSFFSLMFLWLLWLVFYFDNKYTLNLHLYGLRPRTTHGLIGLITSPLIHADFGHILSNSIPLLVLGTLLFYFYKEIALKVFFVIYFLPSILVWLFANWGEPIAPFHIGASDLVYGLCGFLFFSGIIRRNRSLFGVSLIVTFLYGTVVWGIFPTEFQRAIMYSNKSNVSWQGHLAGFITGVTLAFIFRKQGAQAPQYSWETNNDEDIDESDPYWLTNGEAEQKTGEEQQKEDILKNTSDNPYTVTYTFIPKNKDEEEKKLD